MIIIIIIIIIKSNLKEIEPRNRRAAEAFPARLRGARQVYLYHIYIYMYIYIYIYVYIYIYE